MSVKSYLGYTARDLDSEERRWLKELHKNAEEGGSSEQRAEWNKRAYAELAAIQTEKERRRRKRELSELSETHQKRQRQGRVEISFSPVTVTNSSQFLECSLCAAVVTETGADRHERFHRKR